MNLSLPPSVMLLEEKQPTDGWSKVDKKLAIAWTILQKETCGLCGQPLWICRSSERDLLFKVNTDTCYASAEIEQYQESKQAKSAKKGESPFVVPYMATSDAPLPSRKAYLESLKED